MQRCSRRCILAHHSAHLRGLAIFSLVRHVRQAKIQSSTFMSYSPLETQHNTVHPISSSPFPDVRARAQSIKKICRCPVCASHAHVFSGSTTTTTPSPPKMVAFDCPDCGYLTHCSEEHWREDMEHRRYCSRLREVNQDDHDLRSRRQKIEYELPGVLSLTYLILVD